MPELPHLLLPRVEVEPPRKKTGFGRPPGRDYSEHGRVLSEKVETVLKQFRTRRRPPQIDPSLIVRIKLHEAGAVDEEMWDRCDLALLGVDKDKTYVLFSSDAEMSDFRRRLEEYQQGPAPDRKGPPHQQLFASIEEIGEIRATDRIGPRFRREDVTDPAQFSEADGYLVDVELWELGERRRNDENVEAVRQFIEEGAGRVTDHYIGESLVLLRCRCSGAVVRQLLELEDVAAIDLPPRPSLTVSEVLGLGIEDLEEVLSPPDEAPGLAVLDSGLAAGHPLLGPAIGEATTAPRAWGDPSDQHGHGTMVAGIAIYGDVQQAAEQRGFVPTVRLYSARVLNNRCEFDDETLITTQMREAIEYFREAYGCRVFNVSLGDPRLPYHDGKVSPWASILDTIVRELDVVIVVSAGNYNHEPGPDGSPDEHIQAYPAYLLDADARIIEPATGVIVLTVGSLAHSAGVPPGSTGSRVELRPVAEPEQPSPFTRSGPGPNQAIKPELCEVGGNYAYDGLSRGPRRLSEMSVLSTNREYLRRLFTSDVGTSYAAPKVAHAAARLLETFPDASANLVRALLASSARTPDAAVDLLGPLGGDAVLRVCGYGQPDVKRAAASDQARVTLYGEAQLELDNFHVYELPIPHEFLETRGTRKITVTLAFDPPVRHSRIDYMGTTMSFRLIRGRSVDQITEALRQRGRDEEPVDRLTSTRFDCPMEPKVRKREGGTLQKATLTMKRRPRDEYGDTYHVVVRCEKRWARAEHAPQPYAVVVVVEHSAQVGLYNQIQQRVVERIRVRVRG